MLRGPRQRQIIDLLVARGGSLCVEIVLQELGGHRRCAQQTLEKLVAAGFVTIIGRRGRKLLPSALVVLAPIDSYSTSKTAELIAF
jgi:hypothetical protein